MNARQAWLSATTLPDGPSSIAAHPSQLLARAPWHHMHKPAGRAGDIRIDRTDATELWSSVVTAAIHGFEEFTMLLIMAHFAIGILAILFSA